MRNPGTDELLVSAERALELLRDGHYVRHTEHATMPANAPTQVKSYLYFQNPQFRLNNGHAMYLLYEFPARQPLEQQPAEAVA